jgi:hypothetical protein
MLRPLYKPRSLVCKETLDIKARRTVVDLLLSLQFAARQHSLDVFGQNVELEVQ